MESNSNTFSNGKITVSYDEKKCVLAEVCCKGLSEVFRNSVIPWIDLEGAETDKIIKQIKKCPSGALSFAYSETLELVK
ncbi:MAG TPA: (4Fe-4S)-binding protein [Flavobacteriaceae bacterium]|nr:(4Fe-4S)-binding protein [Flavobacteriaceae bacterium]HAT66293.1 (4Fe-4S)-binding protein [Flavobacteriaceae bacterium]|tara:strand:- start:338346 stop:338582 length:237 start_codon:yes stop_codon:yes gene_type:complete